MLRPVRRYAQGVYARFDAVDRPVPRPCYEPGEQGGKAQPHQEGGARVAVGSEAVPAPAPHHQGEGEGEGHGPWGAADAMVGDIDGLIAALDCFTA